jgi:hypothetical protein
MKLDKDPFPVNMNMAELEGKKVLVCLSQAESTNNKEVIIGEDRPSRMIKPKSLRGASRSGAQRPPLSSSWPSTRKAGPTSGGC